MGKVRSRIRYKHPGSATLVESSVAGRGSGDFLTPESGMGKNPEPGSGIREEHPGYYFFEYLLPYQFFGLKILEFFDADPGPGSCQPWIRDLVNPGSGILSPWIRDTGWNQIGSGINILDPRHTGRKFYYFPLFPVFSSSLRP
jgi:hypothetical protein